MAKSERRHPPARNAAFASSLSARSATQAVARARAAIFDLLVGAQQNRWRHRKTERLGGLAVHDHFKGREQRLRRPF